MLPRAEDGGLEGDSLRSVQHVSSQQVDLVLTCVSLRGRQAGEREKSRDAYLHYAKRGGYGDEDNNNRAQKSSKIPGCHRPPGSSYFKVCLPLGSDGALGQSGKRQHNQSKQAA